MFNQGFDIITGQFRDSAVYLVDPTVQLAVATSLDVAVPNQTTLQGRLEQTEASPVVYSLESFESLYDLTKKTDVSASLAAALPKLNLSLAVDATKSVRIDSDRIYYLLTVSSVSYARQPMVNPDLNIEAKRFFALSSREIEVAEAKVTKAESDVQKATTELVTLTTAQTAAKQTADAKKAAYDAAVANVATGTQAANIAAAAGAPLPKVIQDELDTLRANLYKTVQPNTEAQQSLITAQTAVKTKADDVNGKKVLLEQAKVSLSNLRTQLLSVIDNDVMKAFRASFGTHYLSKVFYGWQLFALITLDRRELLKTSSVDVNANVTYSSLTGVLKGHHESNTIAKNAIVNIHVVSNGIKAINAQNLTSMQDLQTLITAFFNPENRNLPAPIDFELKPYSPLLYAQRLSSVAINTFVENIEKSKQLISELLELRALAVRYYSVRDVNRIVANGDIQISALNLAQDPHNVRLKYLFAELKSIIVYLDNKIQSIKADIYTTDAASIDFLAKKIGVQTKLNVIKEELRIRATMQLLVVHSCIILAANSAYSDVSLRFSIPLLAEAISVSMTKLNTLAGVPDITVTANVEDPLKKDLINPAPNNDANKALVWPAASNDEFKITLRQVAQPEERGCEVLHPSTWGSSLPVLFQVTAKELQNTKIIAPQISRKISDFNLGETTAVPRNGAHPIAGNYPVTIRIFAKVPVNLDEVPTHIRTSVEQGLQSSMFKK